MFEAIRDCDEEDWLHNRYRMSAILKELQASASEQSPDGYLNKSDENFYYPDDFKRLDFDYRKEFTPVYFSPQPKVSDDIVWNKIKALHDKHGYFQGDNWKILNKLFKP